MSDTDILIDRIMAALEALKPIVRDVLNDALQATQPVPKPPTVADFVKVGSHTSTLNGHTFNVYAFGADLPKGPHIDKVELKPADIEAVLKQWNAEAQATMKQAIEHGGEIPGPPTVTLRDSLT